MVRLSGRAPYTGSNPIAQRRARRLICQFQRQLPASAGVPEIRELDHGYSFDVFSRQRVEHDDLVDPVDEFRAGNGQPQRQARRASSPDNHHPPPRAESSSEPRFEVMMTTVLRKSTVRP